MNRFSRPGSGWIEVVTGSMFSGKSEELIRRVRRAQIARQRVQIFKPQVDDRYATDHIVSHSEMKMPSQAVKCAQEILQRMDDRTEVVGIDEGQFFDAGLPAVVNALADRGVRVIVAGLDQDYMGRPFEPMPQILAVAEYVDKILAICMQCGAPANRTQRLTSATDRVVVGGSGEYEARCRRCFQPSSQVAAEPPARQTVAAEPGTGRSES
ncbi:MAG TPA: thymidine kinase [Vicinamibacteria bacterium]|nr:thymidine kinase [Vicinamibacteria bacterium]